ncbi:hypothetical protein ERHA55_52790 (plasmid) [Erwinia rhapontici]|nr:hypothetical protein [Erwinia rhapontici]BCQ47752.1 hypothetical protein ERHA55_52790 [Erwinia rhapontici]
MAVHPAYDTLCDGFAPPALRGEPSARQAWAKTQLLATLKAASRLGLEDVGTFSGSLAWPYIFPFPSARRDWWKVPLMNWPAAGDPCWMRQESWA